MIEFQQVCRSYGDKVAVENLNLRVAAGELYSLLGHNGAGKTTAIKMLVGLIRPGSGTIRVGGYDVVTHTREATAADRLRARSAVSVRQAFRPRDSAIRRPDVRHGRRSRSHRAIDREIERFELARVRRRADRNVFSRHEAADGVCLGAAARAARAGGR